MATHVLPQSTPQTDRWKRDWRKALGALRRLMNDADDTTQVFEIMRSLNPPSTRRGYLRLIAQPDGARLAYDRVELADIMMDRDWLDSFAPGSVGAAYRDFITRENLSAKGLAAVSRQNLAADRVDLRDPVAWYARRIRDVHDVWHILTGYGRDPLGEACLVAFSYSQTRGLGWLTIALGAALKGRREPGVRKALLEGWRNGRRSAWLPGIDYETMMTLPIETVRAQLGIVAPLAYHKAALERS